MPMLVFLDLSILDLGPKYATDRRQTDVRRAALLNAPALGGGGIIKGGRFYSYFGKIVYGTEPHWKFAKIGQNCCVRKVNNYVKFVPM